jgi:hypothetical protein
MIFGDKHLVVLSPEETKAAGSKTKQKYLPWVRMARMFALQAIGEPAVPSTSGEQN